MAAISAGQNTLHITALTNTITGKYHVTGVMVCGTLVNGNQVIFKEADTNGAVLFSYTATTSNLTSQFCGAKFDFDVLHVSVLGTNAEAIIYHK